uniref:Membrane protein n=1 Tax=Pithovirus LCPAC403 TaxID=2506596 RepID=A0A481ZD78_9VIRU|nr:MAG: membrane protein [Pithovirus LCPAC403]
MLLFLGETFLNNSCLSFNNPWCYDDWFCSVENGGDPNNGSDFPAKRLQKVAQDCDRAMNSDPSDISFNLCINAWPNVLPDGTVA